MEIKYYSLLLLYIVMCFYAYHLVGFHPVSDPLTGPLGQKMLVVIADKVRLSLRAQTEEHLA